MPGGPARGTDAHRAWMLGEIAAWLLTSPKTTCRRAFLRWQQDERRDRGHAWAINRDTGGEWSALLTEAMGASPAPPVEYQAPQVTPSAAREPQGDHLFPPVPPGFEAKRISTYSKGQWTIAEPERLDDADSIVKMIAELPPIVGVRDYVVPPPKRPRPAMLASAYVIGDHHLGMYADPNETGGAAWDAEHADRVFRRAFDQLVLEGLPSSRAYIVDVGDFLHTDDTSNRTFRGGHQLDVSERWQRLFKRWRGMMVHAIDRCLEQHEEVVVEILPGNHNLHSASAMAVVLDSYYRIDPRVTVSQSDGIFRAHKWGTCLIGATHGHTVKLPKLQAVMANKWPDLWGETTERMWLTGHLHHERLVELAGCVVHIHRTLAPNDAHGAAGGYGSGRALVRYTLHKERGNIGTNYISARFVEQLLREEAAA